MPTFSEQLTTTRKERGITQEQLAEAMGVSRQTVSHWENGRIQPDEATAKRLWEYLKLDESDMPAPEAPAQPSAPKKPRKSFGKLLIAFVCGVLATLLVVYGLLPLFVKPAPVSAVQEEQGIRPADYPFEWYQQPAPNQEGKAYLKLTPDITPVKLMPNNSPDSEYKWNVVFFIEETNGIPFTITKFTETYFNSEQGVDEAYVKTGAECTRFWQTATFQPGEGYGYNAFHYASGVIGYGAAFEGFDANGNELAFGLYIPLSQELERVYTLAEFQQTAPREDGKAYIEIAPDSDPFPVVHDDMFYSGKGWQFLFSITNASDVPFTVKQLTQVLFGGEQALDKRVFTSEMMGETIVLTKDGEPMMHNGGAGMEEMTGIGIMVEGTDANGNELTFVKYTEFARE